MSAICIITARGGSKRIPKKNIREFCGKPMLAYSIHAAIDSGIFDEIMVSTDDREIASIACGYGAKVPFMRSDSTSGDYATTSDVLKEVLDSYACLGKKFDVMCCLYPTAPFVRGSELQNAAKMIENGADSVIPVTSYDFPPLRGFTFSPNGGLEHAFPEYAFVRSQDLPEMVHDCGRFYFAKTEAYEKAGSFMTDKTQALRIPRKFVQDIDTLEDWEIAEQKYMAMVMEENR